MDRWRSGGAAALEPEDSSASVIVFDGSSPAEVSHARQLWSSACLLPPLEVRLMSADIRQRLPVARPQRAGPKPSSPEPPTGAIQRREDRQRFSAMAEQRREVRALLGRQREQRVRRELVSVAVKAKAKPEREMLKAPDCDEDKELVRQLQ